jgi:peptidoglycan/LPS O-acetylase OafA/YrhL
MVHEPGAPIWSTSTYGSQPSFLRTLEDGLWRVYFKDDTNAYNPVMWTMKIEFLGSMLTFGLALLVSRLRFRFAIYALVLLAILATVKDGVYYCLFVVGIALADANPRAIKTLPAAAILALAVWLGGYRDGSTSHAPLGLLRLDIDGTITDTYHLCNAISGALIVYLALCSSPMAMMLAKFKEIGRRSFSLYLTHFAVLGSLGITAYLKLKSAGWGDDSAAIAAAIVTCALSYIVAGWYATWIDAKSVQASRLATIIVDSARDERSTTLPGSTQRS